MTTYQQLKRENTALRQRIAELESAVKMYSPDGWAQLGKLDTERVFGGFKVMPPYILRLALCDSAGQPGYFWPAKVLEPGDTFKLEIPQDGLELTVS
jgi:hypothetical protein